MTVHTLGTMKLQDFIRHENTNGNQVTDADGIVGVCKAVDLEHWWVY